MIIFLFSVQFALVSCISEKSKNEQRKLDSLDRVKFIADSIAFIKQKREDDSLSVIRQNEAKFLQIKLALGSLESDLINRPYFNVDDLLRTINDLKFLSELAKNNSQHSIDSISQYAKKLEKGLKSTQKIIFPKLRKNYIEIADRMLWEEDIDVVGSGKTITFIGGTFASNKNIKDFHEQLSEALSQYRFKQVRYKWYKGDDEYTYYTLHSLDDEDI